MSNVIVDKNKIDLLANAISDKSGEPVTMTLDEMVEAVDSIETGGGGITPTGNINITQAGVTDVTNYATATVPSGEFGNDSGVVGGFRTVDNVRKWKASPYAQVATGGYIEADYYTLTETYYNAVPANTTVTPTESAQTIGGADYMMERAVTVSAIPSNYVGSGITRRDGTDLVGGYDDGIYSVDVPSGYYQYSDYYTVPNGTAGTPTATKGTVTNHSVTVTPSVTNTSGYIVGSTINGTAVSVSASELVSGSQTLSDNGTYDVTNLAEVVVDVQGGSSGMSVATATKTLTTASNSIQFTGLSGQPTSFAVTSSADQNTGGTKAIAVVYDGTSLHGMDLTSQAEADTGFTQSYSNGSLTITATSASFQANEYKLVYTYGGSSANLGTDDVQVGSGATSISFTGLSDEPDYFSCIFTSSFGTSSGYQRVISVVYDGNSTYGLAMDSGAKALSSWSYTYNNGTLTISSQGTNNGGYFHQPGNYHLTYGYGGTVEPTEIEVEPLSVTTNGTYTAPTGKAYSPVTVNVSGGGSSDAVTGTLTVASNVNTSTNTKITDTSAIGFTPTKFFFWRDSRSATSNHVNQATFTTLDSYYIRTRTRYSSNALSSSGDTNNWTTQSSGYLYYNNDTIYFRSSSSYILASGTWHWVAVK